MKTISDFLWSVNRVLWSKCRDDAETERRGFVCYRRNGWQWVAVRYWLFQMRLRHILHLPLVTGITNTRK